MIGSNLKISECYQCNKKTWTFRYKWQSLRSTNPDTPKSGNCFDFDWLLSYWESQSEGSLKQLLIKSRRALGSLDMYFLNFFNCAFKWCVLYQGLMEQFHLFFFLINKNSSPVLFDQISLFLFVSLTGLVLFLNVFDESKRRVQVWTRGMDFSGLFHISAPIGPIQHQKLLSMQYIGISNQ